MLFRSSLKIMADLLHKPLLDIEEQPHTSKKPPRAASLDVFRGLCVFLMMLVDYGGAMIPIIAHSPWNGLHLADSVMPFFLFIAGVSIALVYKKVPNRIEATWKAVLKAIKLFLLGVVIQGGYFHGINSLTYGVDMKRIRWLGILQVYGHTPQYPHDPQSTANDYYGLCLIPLTSCMFHSVDNARNFLTFVSCLSSQKISVGYIVAALCEIWLSCRTRREVSFLKSYYWHWCVAFSLSAIYLGLLYGLYVPDWQFEMSNATSSVFPTNHSYVYMVKCSLRGDLGPACNSAGMIDRYILGIDHLYKKPVYRNLKECNMSIDGQVPDNSASWCHAPFDPEGVLRTTSWVLVAVLSHGILTAYSVQGFLSFLDHKGRMENWTLFSFSLLVAGLLLAVIGDPVNKSLYTFSYMLITSASAGITYSALYLLVDVYDYRCLTFVLEWMGKHSLSIFVLVSSNLAVITIQGFCWAAPENNMIHWIVSRFVRR
ncbi:hypothetical protein POTOM_033533 [Populus tomentosa]|uniref:Heparan-alpha-glucosaminide N-acetyltransferase catalytic domain-containing protein n=1 Tax=Populus tomentosa TaxID=118781 RepID=A0A8X7Z6F9_POPTO|nr:hypothetical protein POTOM_033533 [Populus tomentosa]